MEEELFPDPCAYVNRTKGPPEAAPEPEGDVAVCADFFMERMTAINARDKARIEDCLLAGRLNCDAVLLVR